MGKIRVYKLAKELALSSKELIEILQDLGVDVSSHMSTIEDDTAKTVRDMFVEKESGSEKKSEIIDEKKGTDNEKQGEPGNRDSQEKETTERHDISLPITVKELAESIDYPANDMIKKLMGLGLMANLNHPLDEDTLIMLADEIGVKINIKDTDHVSDEQEKEKRVGPKIVDKAADLQLRPPIITVMGHVDHGKTTLLDVIRQSRVAESEAGGITQHIGAYQVFINGKKITFIDTPGHEAFTAMRARGAQVTDITILVVAADDGVMPQTIEAINHAKAADIPIIIAINKIDKPNAQPDRVKQELTEHGLVPEDWGGDTICVPISALKEENINELLEMVLLVAEMEEIKANPNRYAEGIVIESELDKGRGPVATLLVKNGTMRIGDALLAGPVSGRVRAMIDDKGERINEAPPATPVEILGFSDVPAAGEFVEVLPDEKEARAVAEERKQALHQQDIQNESRISLEDLYEQIQQGKVKELNVIIKADVNGSIEALKGSLTKLGTEEVTVNIIHTGVGAINETDVDLASASNAIIIGFNVRPNTNARKYAEKEKVELRLYRVIYKAIEEIKDAMAGLLDPELKEEVTARAEVRDTFKVPNVGIVAGLYVTDGVINRNDKVRLLRDNVVVFEGEIASLKRFEDDVREVREGYECGLGIEGYNDLKPGDELEIYTYREIKRTL
ncbi:translation initiation factor IF-2 [Halocella sp. SP3-1]|uniref:translation initiation factor IF-2 n=1 Tax=Halocella sp. SP3-1 TaxID=2382161 RepID=UPI000F75BC41|nr:translation initiation factor IF-2 [Halocella sp. SP3-1]AZO95540.1 translation initiation factor IF-2 [Halocella sp. SP3-1]